MATTSSTTKAKPDLTRNKSINRKPKPPSSVSSEDGSNQKPEKPIPNYLKPTLSSRPDAVKLSKKTNNKNSLDDNQKLLRRRSFDKPSSSLTSPSTSSTRNQKSLNVSPSLPRDKPVGAKEKPVTAQRSSSFHGSRGVPRGAKSPLVAPKKSGLSGSTSSSTSLKSKKEVSEDVIAKKVSEKEIPLDIASLSSSVQDDDQEEILKVENDVKLGDVIEETKEDEEVQVEVVQADESVDENKVVPTIVASSIKEEKEEELIKEDKTKEETKEEDDGEEAKKEIDHDEEETPKMVDIEHTKEVENVKETTEEEAKEEEKEKVKEEEKEKEKAKEEEVKKKEVVKGKRETTSQYNDVIASKIQENPRKNKVLALAGAFQTVIDYETAASK